MLIVSSVPPWSKVDRLLTFDGAWLTGLGAAALLWDR
jgi:hypothetical protein